MIKNNPWLDLVEAIVALALADYHKAWLTLSRFPGNFKALETKKEIEEFFESDIFDLYCDFNESLLSMAQKEGFAHDR